MQQLSCGLCCFHPLRHSSVLVVHRSRSVSFLSLLLCTGKQPITKQNHSHFLFVPSNPKLQPPSFPSYTHHCLSKLFRLPASPFLQDSTLHAGHKFKELTVQCPHTVLAPGPNGIPGIPGSRDFQSIKIPGFFYMKSRDFSGYACRV